MRVYILYLAETILRMAMWLVAAGWFYRCTPRSHRFFCLLLARIITSRPLPSHPLPTKNEDSSPQAS